MKLELRVPLVGRIPEFQVVIPLWRLRTLLRLWYVGLHTHDTHYYVGGVVKGWNLSILTPWLIFDIRRNYPEQNTLSIVHSFCIGYRNMPLRKFRDFGYCYRHIFFRREVVVDDENFMRAIR